jgi:peptide/nickel transport system ATP-binding protein
MSDEAPVTTPVTVTAPVTVVGADNFSVRAKGRMLLTDLTLDVKAGEIITVLGRHGSGCETLRDALARQLPGDADTSGTLTLSGRDSRKPHFAYLASPSLIALAPHATMESQLARALARTGHIPLKEAELAMRASLERLSNTPTAARLKLRPNALNLRERALGLLALALAQNPDALIADDVVSGLDPTEADEILNLLLKEQAAGKFALIYFTGDPQVPARLGGRVAVLRDGRLIEEGPAERMSGPRANAYTQSLFRAVPRLGKSNDGPRPSPRSEPLLQVRSIVFDKPAKRTNWTPEGITFDLRRGASLALIGKRGSGRRSIMRAVLGMSRLYYGRVIFDAVDMGVLSPEMRARLRQRVAFISGDDSVLDPRMTVYETIIEPMRAHIAMGHRENLQTAEAMLKRVGLGEMPRRRRMASLSMLDRRRVQVARALAGGPQLVVLYEPLLGLDAPGQALVLDLIKDFRRQEGAAFLVITANFAVAEALAEDALIVRDREIIERGPVTEILREPKEAHTAALIAAVSPPEQALSQEAPQG